MAWDTTLNIKLAIKEYLPQQFATRSAGQSTVTVYKSSLAEEFRYSLDLLEVVEDRYGYHLTIISGQLTVRKWHELFEDSTVTDAVLDRLVHNAYRFELKGPTRRRIAKQDSHEILENQGKSSALSPKGEESVDNHSSP